jgi:hypothetical protein
MQASQASRKSPGTAAHMAGALLWLNALPSPSGACSGGGRGCCITLLLCSESLTTMGRSLRTEMRKREKDDETGLVVSRPIVSFRVS